MRPLGIRSTARLIGQPIASAPRAKNGFMSMARNISTPTVYIHPRQARSGPKRTMSDHQAISIAASRATYTGSTLSFGSAAAGTAIPPGVQENILGLSLNEWTVIGIGFGMLMALAGWLTNLYYKREHLKLAEARLEASDPDGD